MSGGEGTGLRTGVLGTRVVLPIKSVTSKRHTAMSRSHRLCRDRGRVLGLDPVSSVSYL